MISRDRRRGAGAALVLMAALTAQPAAATGTFFKHRADTAAPAPAPAPAPAAPARELPVQTPRPEPVSPAQQSPPPAAIAGRVDAVDSTDTLVVAGHRLQLAGVDGVSGGPVAGLRSWLAANGNQVTCKPAGARYVCTTAQGQDIGQVVVFNGAGKAAADASPLYRQAESQARAAHKGLWRQ